MNYKFFSEKIIQSIKLLDDLKLYKYKNLKNLNSLSDDFEKAFKSYDYKNVFEKALTMRDYHVLLNDDSFLQFLYGKKNNELILTYSYYQNPKGWISFDDFVIDVLKDLSNQEIARELYDQFLDEQTVGNSYVTIRYEYNPCDHKELIHATSHLHIGFRNNIRIPIDKILTPLMFTIFIIKHVYYKDWMKKIDSVKFYLDREKISCQHISAKKWTSMERKEMFFT